MEKKGALPPTYFVLAILIMVIIHFLLPLTEVISFPWNMLGAIPIVLGILLNLIADRDFKIQKTTVKPYQESAALITSGVFRISRNPMYLGFVLILIGIAIFLRTLMPFAIIIVFTILMDIVFIRAEEKMLAVQFENTWIAYKEKVRRWI